MSEAREAALQLANRHGLARVMAGHVQALQELLDRGEPVRHIAIAWLDNPTRERANPISADPAGWPRTARQDWPWPPSELDSAVRGRWHV